MLDNAVTERRQVWPMAPQDLRIGG